MQADTGVRVPQFNGSVGNQGAITIRYRTYHRTSIHRLGVRGYSRACDKRQQHQRAADSGL
jgi:hypothetical protein